MKLHLVPRSERTPQSAFMERYEWLMGWALRFTHGERSEAEDILHDAYVQFQRLGTRLDKIENIDAYLHRTVRNLHLSRVMRRSRNPLVELDSFEYDTLEISVEAVDPFRLAAMQGELFLICKWACNRRPETKSASILLLRFFLRYLPSEIALLCKCNRQTVEKLLQLARRELRQVLKEEIAANADSAFVARITEYRTSETVQQIYREDHLHAVLLQKIFSGPFGECISQDQLEVLYKVENQPGRTMLAHITSCRECLERVNRHLNLQSLAEREDNDEDNPKGSTRSRGPRGSKPSRPVSSPEALLHSAERSAKLLFEHRPERLSVHLDGERKASLALQGTENEFTIEVSRTRQVSFIEVFSEQGMLLAYLPITSLNEGGDYTQSVNMAFSEGRKLCIELRFSQPRPRIALTYHDPLLVELRDPCYVLPAQNEITQPDNQRGSLDLLRDWWRQTQSLLCLPFRTLPRAVFSTMALLLVFLLPLLQIKQTTLSAETLLQRAERWQNTAEGGQVLHRTFKYSERPEKSIASLKERRIEVWHQKNGRSLRRMYDEAGRVMASSTASTGQMNLETAWEYVPSTDAFRAVSATLKITAEEHANSYVMRSSLSEMDLDKATYRPTRMLLHIGTMNVEITEIATETVPLNRTPLVEETALPETGNRDAVRFPTNLDLSEMLVQSRLHELKADLGEDVHVSRSGDSVVVSGVVALDNRREQLKDELKNLPNVRVILKSPEEAASHAMVHRVIDRSEEPNAAPLLQEWMQSRYPGDSERSVFVSHALDQADQCMWHSRALLLLVQRYGDLGEPTVHAIAGDHLARLNEEIDSMQRWVSVLPGPQGEALAHIQVPATVGARVQLMAQTSRELDDEIAELLTAHTLPSGGQERRAEEVLRLCRQHLQLANELIQKML